MATDRWSRKQASSTRKRRPPTEAERQKVAEILKGLRQSGAGGRPDKAVGEQARPAPAYLPEQQLLAQYEQCASDMWQGRERRAAAALRANAIRGKFAAEH